MEFERLRSEGVSAIGTLVCIRVPRSIKNGGRDRRDRPGGTILLSWTLPWTDDPHSVQASEVFSHAAQIPCLFQGRKTSPAIEAAILNNPQCFTHL